ncbi:hypothetical protein predicted by Glimmer/Critica [Sorangium cellulosum So ce56]|uniref:Uncharacterized protein n=1 Tax=Sorangium cellulosum (strain So ce56) TaxID=448385 RepID=A9FHQ9_SORC5|nr:hypothetical protein predicted by Glimmer/Critica [Sorangium cellulosum So ce56]
MVGRGTPWLNARAALRACRLPPARGRCYGSPVRRPLLASSALTHALRLASLASLASLAYVALAVAIPRAGAAQDPPTLSGYWTASALTEQWSVSAWGQACGPRPRPQGAPGGAVQIQQHGSELSISGAGRSWSTAECWEQMPGLARSKHSASGNARSWQTRCTTPASDPRRAVVTTTTQATDASINMVETGQYQFIIQDTTCSASVTRTRTYTLVRRDGEAPPAASAPPPVASAPPPVVSAPPAAPAAAEKKPAASRTCDAPGEPARLEVTPSRKLMRPGERFQFRALVMDAEGCALPTRPTWSIAPGPLASAATVDATGALSLGAGAGEGALGLVASVAGKGVTVAIEVTSPDRYDALLAASGLNEAGESEQAAVVVIAAGTIGGRTTSGEDLGRQRKNLFVAIVGGVAACLGFAGLILLRRGRRRTGGEVEGPASTAGAAGERDSAGAEGAPAPSGAALAGAAGPAAGPVRPTLRARGKICPTCGDRYPSEAMFCGKDGTQLLLLN